MRVVVLISGSGTNLQALIDAVEAGELEAEIAAVIANREDAYGLQRAAEHGIPTEVIRFRKAEQPREVYDAALADAVAAYQPDVVVMAGFMHILTPAFLNRFPRRVINLHPALPREFAGMNAIERAYEAAQRGEIERSGCMVHIAVPEVDAGPVIIQEAVPIHPDDTLDAFAARMHAAEHRIIVEAVRLMKARL